MMHSPQTGAPTLTSDPPSPPALPFALTSDGSLDESARWQLSRYVQIQPQQDGGLRVESLLTGQRLAIASSAQWQLLSAFLFPTRIADLLNRLNDQQRTAVRAFLRLCVENRFLTPVDENGTTAEEQSPIASWEPHDLFFHMRSRRGRTQQPTGAVAQRDHRPETVPAVKGAPPPHAIALPKPDLERLQREDPSLSTVMENRRSCYSIEAVSLEDLGELFYRTCRVTGTSLNLEGETLLQKVYPSGGALHSLEVYALVNRCPQLSRGLYHYHPEAHTLSLVTPWRRKLEGLLWESREDTGRKLPDLPSVLLILTTRFQRVSHKYQAIAYRVVLKEVGVLLQTFYLNATAMGLAPCAVGTGNSDGFAQATGIDYYRETSVGEMILGGRTP